MQIPAEGALPADARGEVLLAPTWGAANLAEAMTRGVRWVHTYGTGVDRFPFEALGDAQLTCSRGASAVPIAEWALAMLLACEKQLPARWISAPPEHWNMAALGTLQGRQLALLGFGGIGRAVAERALAFGMRVGALVRNARPSPMAGVRFARDLGELVADADHLVLAAPLTPATRGLVGREVFARCKPGLHLVNVARGGLVDPDALREALDSGRVARASLDAVEPEPLPEGHWLYTHPRVRLSAHVSWSSPTALDEILDPFLDNLARFRAGGELFGRVDAEAGY